MGTSSGWHGMRSYPNMESVASENKLCGWCLHLAAWFIIKLSDESIVTRSPVGMAAELDLQMRTECPMMMMMMWMMILIRGFPLEQLLLLVSLFVFRFLLVVFSSSSVVEVK